MPNLIRPYLVIGLCTYIVVSKKGQLFQVPKTILDQFMTVPTFCSFCALILKSERETRVTLRFGTWWYLVEPMDLGSHEIWWKDPREWLTQQGELLDCGHCSSLWLRLVFFLLLSFHFPTSNEEDLWDWWSTLWSEEGRYFPGDKWERHFSRALVRRLGRVAPVLPPRHHSQHPLEDCVSWRPWSKFDRHTLFNENSSGLPTRTRVRPRPSVKGVDGLEALIVFCLPSPV